MVAATYSYRPDYAVPPGWIVEEHLRSRGLSPAELARRCGRSAKLISEIIAGKAPVEPKTALQFERVLGLDANIWLGMEARYRLHLAREAEAKETRSAAVWAKTFPVKELVKRGEIEKPGSESDAVSKLLAFFGVGSVRVWHARYQQMNVAYRHSRSFKSDRAALTAWLRLGEIEAEQQECADYNAARFKRALKEIRALTRAPVTSGLEKAQQLCNEAGVALAPIEPFRGTALSGAAWWLNRRKAVIALSARHKTDDHLWFSLFHESAHILLHSKKTVFIDGTQAGGKVADIETQADQWASDLLARRHQRKRLGMPQVTKDRYVTQIGQMDVPHLNPEAALGQFRPKTKIEQKTKKQLIQSPEDGLRPHVVLLGAGASRAAFPNGDRAGQRVPLMNDLVEVLGLRPLIRQAGKGFEQGNDFEAIYSKLASNPHHANITKKIEQEVENYFSSLQLPVEATLYDRLLLSLRKDDVVFTFNWDPFLFDAYQRNRHVAPLPEIFFLHGSVRIGKCPRHERWGKRNGKCPDCSAYFKDVPLLYPVGKKDYSNSPYIKTAWDAAREVFKEALVLTIFGYGAPESDRDAVDLLELAWTKRSTRESEHVEIVDIVSEEILHERWSPFTPTHHLQPRQNFTESWIVRWPRRSREAVWFPMSEGSPCQEFPMAPTTNLSELQQQTLKIAKWEN